MESFNRIYQSIVQETQIESRWRKTTPRIVVRYPAPFHEKKRISLTRLGNVRAFEMDHPRTGKRQQLVDYGGMQDWSRFDVRLASPQLLAEVDSIDEEIRRLEERRKKALHDRFWDNPPMAFEEVEEANEPWYRFKRVLNRAKDGKATQDELRETMDALFPRG